MSIPLPILTTPPTHEEIQAVFQQYAAAYALMESIQKPQTAPDPSSRLLPTGDQKTGCIGEYWAMRYARALWHEIEQMSFSFGNHSQKGWDIEVKISSEQTKYIQVKTASDFGKGSLGAIRHPDPSVKEKKGSKLPDYWDELWIIRLDKTFHPIGFWRVEGHQIIVWSKIESLATTADTESSTLPILRGKTVLSLSGTQAPSWLTRSIPNQIEEFRSGIGLTLLSTAAIPSPIAPPITEH